MTNLEVLLRMLHDPTFETARNQTTKDLLMTACEVALKDESAPLDTELVTLVYEGRHVEYENCLTKSRCTDKDVIIK